MQCYLDSSNLHRKLLNRMRRCKQCAKLGNDKGYHCDHIKCGNRIKIIKGHQLINESDISLNNNNISLNANPCNGHNSSLKRTLMEKPQHEESQLVYIDRILSNRSPNCVNTDGKNSVSVSCDNEVSTFFLDWLASVTERINQTMHFQFPGKPEPLVFHIPESNFECLHKRMSCTLEDDESGKRRLPDFTRVFVRKDSVPLGTFTIYSWQLYNLSLVCRIFNTPKVQLQTVKYFKHNPDGSHVEAGGPLSSDSNVESSVAGVQRIVPGRLITFIKVGNNSQYPESKVPFTIEWIPNILPISGVGELRIKFQYGIRSK